MYLPDVSVQYFKHMYIDMYSVLYTVQCDKSLGVFRAIARSAARNTCCSTEFSEVQNPCYSWLVVIQLNLGQLPAIVGNVRIE